MTATVSAEGHVILPCGVAERLGFAVGEPLSVLIEGEKLVLSRSEKRTANARIIKDPLTGLPVLSIPGAEPLTSEQVAKLLEDFP